MSNVHPSDLPPSLLPSEAGNPLLSESRPTEPAVVATPPQIEQTTSPAAEEEFLGPVIDHSTPSQRERRRLLDRAQAGLLDRAEIDQYNS